MALSAAEVAALVQAKNPVLLAKRSTKFPEKGCFFVIAANGTFVHKDYPFWEGLVPTPAKGVPGLVKVAYCVKTSDGSVAYLQKREYASQVSNNWSWKKDDDDEEDFQLVDPANGKVAADDEKLLSVEPYINMNLPKLPEHIVYQALLFFREVYNEHSSEAAVIIAYRESDQSYVLHCPNQKVSAAHVHYEREFAQTARNISATEDPQWAEILKAGYSFAGTIHSHCNFNAFHSGTDTHDEERFNGVHITLGHVVSPNFSVSSSLVLHEYRELVDIENVALGVKRVGDAKSAGSRYISSGMQNFYEIDLPAEEMQRIRGELLDGIKKNWMPKVSHETFFSKGGYSGGSSSSQYSSGGGYSVADDYDGIPPGGETYILVNGVWVKEDEDDTEVVNQEDIWAEKDEKDKDVPDFEEWAKKERAAGRDPDAPEVVD